MRSEYRLGDIVDVYDYKRRPLSTMARSKMQGCIPYYSANGVIDHINKSTFHGRYILIAEDGSVRTPDGHPVIKLTDSNEDFWVSNHAHVLKASRGIDTQYLYYNLSQVNIDQCITGAVQLKVSQENLLNLKVSIHDIDDQRHIVGTIGTIDDLIEKNKETMAELIKHALVLFGLEATKVGTEKLGKHISFVKGKKPQLRNQKDALPYLSIDALTGQEPVRSTSGVFCCEEDILMVMDGASSGKVFTGFRGYVGSTLAKVVTDLPASLVYFFLYKHQEDSMNNTKGSAIPHADKGFVGELDIPVISDSHVIDGLSTDLRLITSLRKENEGLKRAKYTLLSKYF